MNLAIAAVDSVEMPKVNEIWSSIFGWECVITGMSVVKSGVTYYRYKTVLKNGRHYEGILDPKNIYDGTNVKLADEAPKTHPVFLPEKVVDKFQGMPKLTPPEPIQRNEGLRPKVG